MAEFREMFDPTVNLTMLRASSNKDPNLINMMRAYKVPVGLSPEEQERANEYFDRKQQENKKWYQVFKKKEKLNMLSDNNHSKVIYLMGPDNQFL